MKKFSSILRNYGMFIGFGVIFVIFSLSSEYFLDVYNLMNILVQSSLIAIIAVGQTFVILTGGIDLSVGSIVALTSVSTGLMLTSGISIPLAIIFGVLVGLGAGLVNGITVSFGKVPAFIVTLGMMSIARGGALAMNSGKPVSGLPFEFERIASTEVFGIPIFAIYMLVIYAIGYFILYKTRLGRHIFAIGGNREATKLSGVNVPFNEMMAYAVSGLLAGLGGVLLTARLNYATPISGNAYELDTIAAVVIGGTSLAGGEGGLIGTLIGALLLGTLRNGLTLLNVVSYYQQIIIGVVIVLAVFYDRMKTKKG
ncbi:MAG TPA: ABC transporter permease [Thermotogota bacterium]|nr:ABC transporter permease [Thermotogota bacterium]HPJ88289.1 ABC transporter permease [Thermotogota bacterium]HPR95364.1 ABC transporter permease [Thermotogota bacterium]